MGAPQARAARGKEAASPLRPLSQALMEASAQRWRASSCSPVAPGLPQGCVWCEGPALRWQGAKSGSCCWTWPSACLLRAVSLAPFPEFSSYSEFPFWKMRLLTGT